MNVRVHAIQTGTITVKRAYRTPSGSNRLMRLNSVLLDRNWLTIPVFTWVIQHPEGTIVVDTGESAQARNPEWFPAPQRPFWMSQYRFNVTPDQEIGAQLRDMGIEPESIKRVILTHGHFDHTDGLYHFPNAEFLISRKEHDDVQRYRSAHFAFPSHFPSTFKPRIIDYVPEPIGTFDMSHSVTKDGTIRLVPTPGHTMGHQSVIVQDGNRTIFLGGDSSFDQDSLLNDIIDAPAFNAHVLRETRRRILDFARDEHLVYLTTHDWDTPERLAGRVPLQAVFTVNQAVAVPG
jgi:N-acyl homoserine lactone hydrolase